MLPRNQVLIKLIKSNTSFLLYGQKASGKTTLIHKLLQEANAKFIEINCTLTARKATFLNLFNVELNKFLKNNTDIKFQKLGAPNNLDHWINQIKKLISTYEDTINVLDNLVVFMDNIQELSLNQFFIPTFYTACQKEFPFRLSFIFCGINFRHKQYTLELPFRTMISYCMPKPTKQYKDIIQEITLKTFTDKVKNTHKNYKDFQLIKKAANSLALQIKAAFDSIQYNLQKMKGITKTISEHVVSVIEFSNPYKSLISLIHKNELKDIMQQVIEKGGVMADYQIKRKINAPDMNEQIIDINNNLEYYPYLILSSIHLADYYHQKEDKRRFQDYKTRTNQRNKQLKKSDFKIGKHNIHRIIAISESLQSQARQNDKQRILEHHSLDFYATFEHLKKMNRLKFFGNKLTGVVKEQEAKVFLNKHDLKYDQFMSS